MTLRRVLIAGIGCAIVVCLVVIAFLFRMNAESVAMFEEAKAASGPIPTAELYADLREYSDNPPPEQESKTYALAGYRFTLEEAIEHIELADVVMSAAEDSWLRPNRFRLGTIMTRIESPDESDYVWLNETLPQLQDLHDVIVEFAEIPGPYAQYSLDQDLLTRPEHLNRVNTLVRFIMMFAHMHGHNREYDMAFSELETALRLSGKLALEPSFYGHSTHQTLNKNIFSEGAEILPNTGLSDSSRSLLMNITDPGRSRKVFAGSTRLQGILTGESFRSIRLGDSKLLHETFGENVKGFHEFLYRSPLGGAIANRDATYYILRVQQTAQSIEDGTYLKSVSAAQISEGLSALPGHYLAMHARAPHIAGAGLRVQQNEAIIRLFKLGLLIEIHIKENGIPPESLESFTAETPLNFTDPFTGNALRYVVKDNGFTLYSIGQNEIDDGGRHHYDRGDIVWRGIRMDIDRELELLRDPLAELPEGMQSGGAAKN